MECLNLRRMQIFFCSVMKINYLEISGHRHELSTLELLVTLILKNIATIWYSNLHELLSYSNFVKYCHSLSKPLFLSFKGCIMTCLLWGLNHIMYAYADFHRSFHHQESIFLISTQVAVYASNCINYKWLFYFLLI